MREAAAITLAMGDTTTAQGVQFVNPQCGIPAAVSTLDQHPEVGRGIEPYPLSQGLPAAY